MKITNLVLILIGFLSISNHSALCEIKKEFTKEELYSIYSNKLKELNLSTVDADKIRYDTFDAGIETEWGRKVWDVACLHSGIGMKIDPFTGALIGLNNYYILRKTTGPTTPVFEGSAKPARNKQEIIKEAEGYLKILYGGIPQDAFFDKAEYNANMGPDTRHSYEGNWVVNWGRKTDGYKYRFDSITVVVYEKYGLSGYGYNFFSDPPKSLIVNITKEKAIEIAKPFARKMAKLFGYQLGEVLSAELMITNPNFFEGQFVKGFCSIGVKDYKSL